LGSAPDSKFAAKAGELQLEDFKKVDKKILDKVGMTEEQYREFLKGYEDMLKKRKEATTADKNNQVRGTGTGASPANRGARRVQGNAEQPKDLQRGGAVLAPPEFRDGYKGFTEDVSKTGRTPQNEKK